MDAKRVFLIALVIIVSWELWLFCLRNAWFKPVASEVSLSTMLGDVLSGPSHFAVDYKGPILSLNISLEGKCQKLFQKVLDAPDGSATVWPPPKSVPPQLVDAYTLGGNIPILPLYVAERQNGGVGYKWSRTDLETLGSKPCRCGGYGKLYCDAIFDKYADYIENKDGVIFGSQSPWAEAALLARGASHLLTVEYMKIETDHPRLSTMHPRVVAKNYSANQHHPADFVFSFSSLEHDGLGRYGDPLNPFGDLEAIARVHCLLKPGGVFFFAVPVGQDAVVWNAHRIYGRLRLRLLLAQWEPIDLAGSEYRIVDKSKLGHYLNQPIWVLRKRIEE